MGGLSFVCFSQERQRERFTEETSYYLYQSRQKSGTVETREVSREMRASEWSGMGKKWGPLNQPTLSGLSRFLRDKVQLLGKVSSDSVLNRLLATPRLLSIHSSLAHG